MVYTILKDLSGSCKLFVSPSFLKENNLESKQNIAVCFGAKRCEAEVEESLTISENSLLFSSDIIYEFHIPLELQYQIICNKNVIIIGPFIGLLLARTNLGITNALKRAEHNEIIISPQGVNEFTRFTMPYSNLHGVLFLFSLEGVNFKRNCVEGYFYNSNATNFGDTWRKAVLPIPQVIYRRIYIPEYSKNKLINITNNKMFNSHYYNKWDFWNIASKYPSLKNYLPETKEYTSFENLDEMLKSNNLIFLKLRRSALAKGLIKVIKKNTCYIFQRSDEIASIEIENRDSAKNYLSEILQGRSYLIQQGVDVLKFENRCTSFRVIMQKDETQNWKCTGICPRIGIENGICSNFQPAHYNLSFENFFKTLLDLSEEDIASKKEEIIAICHEICKAFDNTGGLFADIGIDIGINTDLNIWIFEVNERHHHHVPLKTEDEMMFNAVKCNPIKYATVLSGFSIINI